jgi:hypothetical protein
MISGKAGPPGDCRKEDVMKIAIALLTVAFGASLPLAAASASEQRGDAGLTALTQHTDVSAAKKKRSRVYVYPTPFGYYHAYPRAFSPGDPSYQSPELIRLRSLNRCVFDLGYGRWENCN